MIGEEEKEKWDGRGKQSIMLEGGGIYSGEGKESKRTDSTLISVASPVAAPLENSPRPHRASKLCDPCFRSKLDSHPRPFPSRPRRQRREPRGGLPTQEPRRSFSSLCGLRGRGRCCRCRDIRWFLLLLVLVVVEWDWSKRGAGCTALDQRARAGAGAGAVSLSWG